MFINIADQAAEIAAAQETSRWHIQQMRPHRHIAGSMAPGTNTTPAPCASDCAGVAVVNLPSGGQVVAVTQGDGSVALYHDGERGTAEPVIRRGGAK